MLDSTLFGIEVRDLISSLLFISFVGWGSFLVWLRYRAKRDGPYGRIDYGRWE